MNLNNLYKKLLKHYGYQKWWPVDVEYHKKYGSDPKDEIVIGAILTQNTNWKNVEKALENLKKEKTLNLHAIFELEEEHLKELIRPAGFFQRKLKILKEVSYLLTRYYPTREALLNRKGVGKETADSILLYAYNEPFFVIDMYTKRILYRLTGIVFDEYDEYAKFIKSQIPQKIDIYKEFHALFVKLAKESCQKTPRCDVCPLKDICKKNI